MYGQDSERQVEEGDQDSVAARKRQRRTQKIRFLIKKDGRYCEV